MTDDELFLTAILKCSRSDLYIKPLKLTREQQEQFVDMQRRRLEGEPVQYIVGFTEFMGHRIEVGPEVLIPRPETEMLVQSLIDELMVGRRPAYFVLDIGTGSGCIPVSVVKELQGARAVGIDPSVKALAYARRNVEINEVTDKVTLVERDVFYFMDETLDRFDAVVSNPPYIPSFMLERLPEDVQREPKLALDGGPDGLHFYRYIIPTAWRVLKTDGVLALEFGDGQRKELEKLFDETGGWDRIRFVKDLAGKYRVALARKNPNIEYRNPKQV